MPLLCLYIWKFAGKNTICVKWKRIRGLMLYIQNVCKFSTRISSSWSPGLSLCISTLVMAFLCTRHRWASNCFVKAECMHATFNTSNLSLCPLTFGYTFLVLASTSLFNWNHCAVQCVRVKFLKKWQQGWEGGLSLPTWGIKGHRPNEIMIETMCNSHPYILWVKFGDQKERILSASAFLLSQSNWFILITVQSWY